MAIARRTATLETFRRFFRRRPSRLPTAPEVRSATRPRGSPSWPGLCTKIKEIDDDFLKIGDVAPNFTAETTQGRINFHDWIGDSWAVLFSHPKDFTPVCTTELGYMAKLKPEFDKRNSRSSACSVDPVDDHASGPSDIEETQGHAPNYPDDRRPRPQDRQALRHAAGRRSASPAKAAPPPTTRPCATSSSSGPTRRSS